MGEVYSSGEDEEENKIEEENPFGLRAKFSLEYLSSFLVLSAEGPLPRLFRTDKMLQVQPIWCQLVHRQHFMPGIAHISYF